MKRRSNWVAAQTKLNSRSRNSNGSKALLALSAAAAFVLCKVDSSYGQWIATGGGSWNNPVNWQGGTIPNGTSASATFGSSILNPSTVTLDGNKAVGVLLFSNTNSYTIAQGTGAGALELSNGPSSAIVEDFLGSHTISAPVILFSNSTFEVISPNPADTLTVSGAIADETATNFGVNIQGTGTVIFSANNTYLGPTSIQTTSAILQIGNGGSTGNLGTYTGGITDNGTLAFDVSGTTVISNTITGSGSLTQNSPIGSYLILTGTNTYLGSTNILSGTVLLAGPSTLGISPLGTNANVIFGANGTLDLNGNNTTLGALSGPGGTIDNLTAGGNLTLTVGSLNTNTTWGGVIANSTGTINFLKQGIGIITFNNTNSYTGFTTITGAGSAILAAVTNAINPNSTITTTNINDGLILGPGVTLSSPFVIGTGNVSELMDVPTGNAVYAGNISVGSSGSNQYRMGIHGTGSLTLTGTTSYATTNLFLVTNGNIVYGGNAVVNIPAVTFGLGRSTGHGIQVLLENNASITAAAVNSGENVSESFMNLYIQDHANMQLSGGYDMENSTNTASSGNLFLNGGTLSAAYFFQTQNPSNINPLVVGGNGTRGSIADSTYMNLNGGVLAQTAVVGTNVFIPAINNLGIFSDAGGALFNSNGLKMTVATEIETGGGAHVGDGGVQKLGLGTLVLNGFNPAISSNSTFLGPTVVNGGLLELVNSQSLGGLGPATTPAPNITNFGYTPSVTVNAGGASGIEGGSLTGANSAAFIATLENSNTGGSPQINLGGLALDPNDAAVNIDYTGTVGGAFNMSNASLVNMSIGALSAGVTYTGTITPGASGYLLGGGGTLTLPNFVGLNGTNNVTIENGGTVQLVNVNSYTGTTTVKGSYVMADPFLSTQPYQGTTVAVSFVNTDLGNSSPAAANLILDGGTLRFIGTSLNAISTNRLFTITSAGATIDASGTVPLTFTNTGADVSTDAPNQIASISGATITGIDTHQLAVGMTVSDTLDGFSNATITGITPNSITLGTNNFSAQSGDTFSFGNQNRTLTLTGTGTATLDSTLQDGMPLAVSKTGTGTWTLAGTNSYSGGTAISAGTLQISNSASMGNSSGATTLNGGTLEVLLPTTESRNFFLGAPNSTIKTDASYEIDSVIANAGAVAGGLTVAGSIITNTKLILTGSNTYTGTTTINNSSTLQLGNGGSSGSVPGNIVDNGSLAFDRSDPNLTYGGAITGSGTVTQVGTGTTTLSNANLYTGQTTISAGTLVLARNSALPSGDNVLNNSNLVVKGNNIAGNVSGSGTTSVSGNVILIANNFTQGSLQNNGTVLLSGTGTIGSLSGTGRLHIENSSQIKLAPGGSGDTQGDMTIDSPSAALDITDNQLVINYGVGNPSTVGAFAAYIASGYNGDAWNGTGINSSKVASVNAAHTNAHLYAIGYADASDPAVAADHFASGTVVIEPTLVGDANLDGKVNFSDFLLVSANFNKPGASWDQGNFDYSPKTDFGDFLLLSANFNNSTPLDSAQFNAMNQFARQFGDTLALNADGTGFTVVPEPASLGLLGAASLSLLARRKRKKR